MDQSDTKNPSIESNAPSIKQESGLDEGTKRFLMNILEYWLQSYISMEYREIQKIPLLRTRASPRDKDEVISLK